MSFQRARTEEQIQKRIDEIIDAAALIYDKEGFEELNFSKISELTQFTRPTIYKYFSTKEEILLKIMIHDLKLWTHDLTANLKGEKLYSVEVLSEIWSCSLSKYPRLIELFTFLFTTLEKNVSKEALIDFKVSMLGSQQALISLLVPFFPKASLEEIEIMITSQLSLVIGLYPMCHLTELQLEVIKLSNTGYTPPNFEKTYHQNCYQLFYALQNKITITHSES